MKERIVHFGVGSSNPVKIAAVDDTIRLVTRSLKKNTKYCVKGYMVDSGVSHQPIGLEEIYHGAFNRVNAVMKYPDVDYGIGLEAGIYKIAATHLDLQFCVISDRDGRITTGHSGGFAYPPSVIEEVKLGKEIGDIFASISGNKNIKHENGAIGMLSKGIINRKEFSMQSVLMAMIPRISPEMY